MTMTTSSNTETTANGAPPTGAPSASVTVS